jgi:hypothetical protein
LQLKEFVDSNEELKKLLDSRSDKLDEERRIRDENLDLMIVGPVIELRFTKLKNDGVIVSIALPDKV